MKCFLTGNFNKANSNELNPENGLVERLRAALPNPCEAVYVCSAPNSPSLTDRFAKQAKAGFEAAGFAFSVFTVLDRRNQDDTKALVQKADLLLFAGGHVPTQNRFFQQIALRDALEGFDGVILGVSAGSMNCSEVVYAPPELKGEALDPDYPRYYNGLGLTKAILIPHYQILKTDIVDGLRLMEDIAYPDSMGRRFYAIIDGSYIYLDTASGREEICGESYIIENGVLTPLSVSGEVVPLR
ncbi:Type 1 glutamine amidotransferase-like domain-containing protein [Candidatus Allofournierella excrementigallinarum]|uniref:Type 1 glutamine amidotransferase-like domain-containing protein n=1 Tax=Candidatus Allofournierella excrementigallinarum TaxID=2838592 RepID=UPI00374FB229